MSELFEDEEKDLPLDEEVIETEDIVPEDRSRPTSNARRLLEELLEKKRLQSELEDFLDY
jgi:hypothetical protein